MAEMSAKKAFLFFLGMKSIQGRALWGVVLQSEISRQQSPYEKRGERRRREERRSEAGAGLGASRERLHRRRCRAASAC